MSMATWTGTRADHHGAVRLPLSLAAAAEMLLAHLKAKNSEPVRFELTFGPEALESLSEDRDLLRSIMSIRRLFDVEVVFPERPGDQLLCLDMRLVGSGDLYFRAGVHVERLLDGTDYVGGGA